jgi:hypothetical protein
MASESKKASVYLTRYSSAVFGPGDWENRSDLGGRRTMVDAALGLPGAKLFAIGRTDMGQMTEYVLLFGKLPPTDDNEGNLRRLVTNAVVKDDAVRGGNWVWWISDSDGEMMMQGHRFDTMARLTANLDEEEPIKK